MILGSKQRNEVDKWKGLTEMKKKQKKTVFKRRK